MEKRIVISGCRNYDNYEEAKKYIDFCISRMGKEHKLTFVSGVYKGADLVGERKQLSCLEMPCRLGKVRQVRRTKEK